MRIVLKWNEKSKIAKTIHSLAFKDQFSYLKTAHSFHLVDPSPWPLVASLGAFMYIYIK